MSTKTGFVMHFFVATLVMTGCWLGTKPPGGDPPNNPPTTCGNSVGQTQCCPGSMCSPDPRGGQVACVPSPLDSEVNICVAQGGIGEPCLQGSGCLNNLCCSNGTDPTCPGDVGTCEKPNPAGAGG
jgi:hypothetical protein